MERGTLQSLNGLKLITSEGVDDVPVEGVRAHAAELQYFVQCLCDGVPVSRCLPEESALAVKYSREAGGFHE